MHSVRGSTFLYSPSPFFYIIKRNSFTYRSHAFTCPLLLSLSLSLSHHTFCVSSSYIKNCFVQKKKNIKKKNASPFHIKTRLSLRNIIFSRGLQFCDIIVRQSKRERKKKKIHNNIVTWELLRIIVTKHTRGYDELVRYVTCITCNTFYYEKKGTR